MPISGIVVLAVALVAAAGIAVLRARTDGRFKPTRSSQRPEVEEVAQRPSAPLVEEVAQRPSRDPRSAWSRVAAALPDEQPGERATLVQFSSAFCAPCRTTRVVLADVAGRADGVRHVEVDAEKHLDLVRALDVRRTPTTLVLDAAGHELVRAAGAPTRDQVLAALPEVTAAGGRGGRPGDRHETQRPSRDPRAAS